jgi:hypothetical protein
MEMESYYKANNGTTTLSVRQNGHKIQDDVENLCLIIKFIWKQYVRVVQKTRKDILTKQQQRIRNQTKNQPSSLYQPENISA